MRRTSANVMPRRNASYVTPHTHGRGVLRLATAAPPAWLAIHPLVGRSLKTRLERGRVDDRDLQAIRRVTGQRVVLTAHEHLSPAPGQEPPAELPFGPRTARIDHRRAGDLLQALWRHRGPDEPR